MQSVESYQIRCFFTGRVFVECDCEVSALEGWLIILLVIYMLFSSEFIQVHNLLLAIWVTCLKELKTTKEELPKTKSTVILYNNMVSLVLTNDTILLYNITVDFWHH